MNRLKTAHLRDWYGWRCTYMFPQIRHLADTYSGYSGRNNRRSIQFVFSLESNIAITLKHSNHV